MTRKRLILVTGTGRSGTSTMAGSLHLLGLYVPGPYLGANDSNPKGFYESRWAVRFHKQIARAAGIHEFDSRPTAFDRAQAAITPADRHQLVEFLRRESAEHDQVVVKDPRSAWTQQLWKQAAHEAGLDICFVSMLRHPAEVVGSRTTYYASNADEGARRRYETFNVARWVNASLVSERETRDEPRTFVSYDALLEDWRPELDRVRRDLGIDYPNPWSGTEPHEIDDFIDRDLNRHAITWADLEIPVELRDLAEQVWGRLNVLREAAGHDKSASSALDDLSDGYARLFAAADAISHDATEEARFAAREEAARGGAAQPAPGAPPLDQVPGRELVRALVSRARARVRR